MFKFYNSGCNIVFIFYIYIKKNKEIKKSDKVWKFNLYFIMIL